MAFEEIEYFPGMEIGKGFDTISEDMKITPAVRGKISPPDNAAGQSGIFNCSIIRNTQEFEEALDVNVSVGGGFGPFRASAKTKYKNKCKVSSEAIFVVVGFNVLNAFESFDDVELTQEAVELLQLNKNQRFKERFGNRFISGRFTGGEYYATIRIESDSYERQESLALEMQAKFGSFFDAKASVAESSKISASRSEINILTYQTGGTIEPVFSIKELLEHSVEVSQQILKGRAVPLSFTLEDYSELERPNDDVSIFDEYQQTQVKHKLTQHYKDLLELQEDIDYVLRNQEFYQINSAIISDLNRDNQLISKGLNEISDRMTACIKDPLKCEQFTPTYPKVDIPPRKKKPTTATKPKPKPSPSTPPRRAIPRPTSLQLYLAAKRRELSATRDPKRRTILLTQIAALEHQIATPTRAKPR